MAEAKTKKKTVKKKAAKKPVRVLVRRGKRKRAIARATIREGKGRITINRFELCAIENPVYSAVVAEPLAFFSPEQLSKVNVSVRVEGGGDMGQAQAVRTAIARAISDYYEDEGAKERMTAWDRSLLVEDSRRVEPKKFKGPKARARFTKSYR